MDGEPGDTPNLTPATVGQKLRAAREAQGIELAEIAARTRVPQRHLMAIEKSDYSGLPSPTYAVGFVKAYARAVGADEVELARQLRAETASTFAAREVYETYDPEDPVREPPRGLAMAGVIGALLVVIAVTIWYSTDWFRGSTDAPEPVPSATATPEPTPSATPTVAAQQVTLVAIRPVWMRVNDGTGTRIFEKEMAPGERYDVPLNVENPTVNIARPEAMQVLINGTEVPALGKPGIPVRNLPITAEALQARAQPTPTPSASATAAPRPAQTSAPASQPSVSSTPRAAATPAPVRTTAPAVPAAVTPAPQPAAEAPSEL